MINEEVNSQKPKIFISTAHKNSEDEQSGTGDVDYATAIFEETNKILPGQVSRISGLFLEQDIYKHIKENGAAQPTLHIMINPPRTGMAFTAAGLKGFKEETEAKIIVTTIEFAKLCNNPTGPLDIAAGLELLNIADQIIFLDSHDKDSAYVHADLNLKQKIDQATVIPVLSTIEPLAVPLVERGRDIISFGMIRVGKGLGLVIELAQQLKLSGDKSGKKVLVVGTVQDNHGGAEQLKRLIHALYSTKKEEIESKTTTPELKNLLKDYKEDPTLIPELPLEIHVDVPKEQLKSLFDRCTYSFLPAYRGATIRNSSISCSLAQKFITYSHSSYITPPELLSTGVYAGALVLFDKFNTDSGKKYVQWVLADILNRNTNPILNADCQIAIEKLLKEQLSSSNIAQQHIHLYQGNLSQTEKTENIKALTTIRPFFGYWYSKLQAKRAYTQFNKAHNINIKLQAKKNWSQLIARLGHLKQEEISFFDSLIKNDWYLTHATDAYQAIQMSGHKLLSLKERSRKNPNLAANRNTNPFEGNDDNIFFAFGPGKVSSPQFLEKVSHVVEVDVNKGFEEQAASLHGIWSSGHVYAFATEQNSTPINIDGTRFSIFYRKTDPNGKNTAENLTKIFRFEYENGDKKEITIGIQDEIFDSKYLKPALILMTIEKVRLLGNNAWTKIMQERTSIEEQQQIVQTLFHVGVFEVHKPASFPLKQSFVKVVNKSETSSSQTTTTYHSTLPLITAIEAGDVTAAQQALNTGVSVNDWHYDTYIERNALTAALLSGKTTMVDWCLNNGAKIFYPYAFAVKKDNFVFSNTAISTIIALASPEIKRFFGQNAQQNLGLFKQYLGLLLNHGATIVNNPPVRGCAIISERDIVQAIQVFKLSEDDLCYLVEKAIDIHSRNLPIVMATTTGYTKLVELMLRMGANVNQQRYEYDPLLQSYALPDPLQGFTPLLQAVLLKNKTMIELLLQYNADVNLACMTDRSANIPQEWEGYTPLKMAQHIQAEEDLVELLKKAGANENEQISWHNLPPYPTAQQFLTIHFVLCIQNDAGKQLIVLRNNHQEKTINSMPFIEIKVGPIFDINKILRDLLDNINIYDVSTDKLAEFGFLAENDGMYYGHQIHYLTIPKELIDVLQEMTEHLTTINLADLPSYYDHSDALEKYFLDNHKGSHLYTYALNVLTSLQNKNSSCYSLNPANLEQIKEAWIVDKKKLLELKKAIEISSLDNIKLFLLNNKDINIGQVYLPGPMPPEIQVYDPEEGIAPIELAIHYKNMDCILVLLEKIITDDPNTIRSNYHRYAKCCYSCLELACEQDDLKAINFFNANQKTQSILKKYLTENSGLISLLINNPKYTVANKAVVWLKEQTQITAGQNITSTTAPKISTTSP